LLEDHGCQLLRCGVLHFDGSTIVLTSQTTFKADSGFIYLKLDEERCINLRISTSRSLDWTAAIQTAIGHKTVEDTLRKQTTALWN
jgi:hypothetical protein